MDRVALARKRNARVSRKDAIIVLRRIKGKNLDKAEKFIKNLIERKSSINGKYYTGACKAILELVNDARNNAEVKGLKTDKLFIKRVAVNKSFTFILPKSRVTHRGRKAKICNLEIEVEER